MISYSGLVRKTEQLISFGATAWIPQRPWVALVSGGAYWYGRRVALTYVPGFLADHFIRMTIIFLGSETAGRILGATLVAPMLTPSLTPMAATVAGGILFYTVSLICNLAVKIFAKQQHPEVNHDSSGKSGTPSPV